MNFVEKNECPLCSGKRVLPKVVATGIIFEDCPCVAKDSWTYKLDMSNVAEKYRDFEISQLSAQFRKDNKDDLNLVFEYINDLAVNIKGGRGLFFQSDPGLAKSSLAVYIVKKAISLGFSCYTGRMSRYMSLKFSALRDPDAKELVDRLIYDTNLLVVEEIEKVFMSGNNDAMTEILVSEFFGELYDQKKALIVTSNLPRKGLGKLPSHILDRFDEMITDIVFVGESFRHK